TARMRSLRARSSTRPSPTLTHPKQKWTHPIALMTKPDQDRPRAVVCLSGGMDSCVCATLAAQDYEVYALHFSYGQRTEARELRSAEEVARIVGVRELLPLKM